MVSDKYNEGDQVSVEQALLGKLIELENGNPPQRSSSGIQG